MSTAFERKAVAYVRKHYPGREPVIGTVTFQTDVSAYGDLEADIDVSWTETVPHVTATGRPLPGGTQLVVRNIAGKAFDYDLNELISEIVEIEDPGE